MTIRGLVESTKPNQISGWAFDTSAPQHHLTVTASVDGVDIATGIASLQRQDLLEAGIAKGDHGFTLDLQPHLNLEAVKRVTVTALDHEATKTILNMLNAPPRPALNIGPAPAFPLPTSDPTQRPTFIMGPARSGTSAMTLALLRTEMFDGYEEGHLLELLGSLNQAVLDYYRINEAALRLPQSTLIRRVPEAYFSKGIQAMFICLVQSVYSRKRWLDKTPNHAFIALAPVFKSLWPNSRFIFMKRRGLENIVSRLRNFPNTRFADLCADWAKGMQNWIEVRSRLGDAAIEVEQLHLACEPEKVANKVANHLNLPQEAAAKLRDALWFERPEKTTDKFATPLTLKDTGWDDNRFQIFQRICGPIMKLYGYGLDASYWSAESVD